MKKLFLTLFVSLALCGSVCAQYESNWPDFYSNAYENQGAFVAAISVNGTIIDATYTGWDALELGFFVGDECRGNNAYLYNGYVEEYGDPFPIIDGVPVYYDNPGEPVTVSIYDHLNGVLYENCPVTYLGEPFEVITGDDNMQGWFDPENPLIVSITTDVPTYTFTKDIIGYGDGVGYYYIIASPFNNMDPTTVTNMITDGADLYYFDQTKDEEWRNYRDSDGGGYNLESGKGYLYASEATTTLTFTGTEPYSGDGKVTLTKTAGAGFEGWNLIGNPFPETAQLPADRPFYVMNEGGTEFMASESAFVEGLEGLFIHANEDGEELYFTVDKAREVAPMVSLNLSEGRGVIDRAIVKMNNSGELPKVQLNPENTKIYIKSNDMDYAVVSGEGQDEMPLNFKAATTGNYTLSLNTQNVDLGYMHLIDRLTGADVDMLADGSYTFVGSPRDNENRFIIRFSEKAASDVFAYQNNDDIIVNGEGTLQVFDIMGRFVGSYEVNGTKRLSASQFSNAVYIFRLIGNETLTQKIVVR